MGASVLLRMPVLTETPPPMRPREAVLQDLERVETYPVLSDTTVRATALLNTPNASVGAIAEIVKRDGFVAASVLRMANSVRYRGRTLIEDLTPAIVRIGLRECANLISTVGIRRMFDKQSPAVQKACDRLHRHSLFVANIAGGINKTFSLGLHGMPFTAGLLHDIGRVIICSKVGGLYGSVDPMDFREEDGLLAREREVIGIDHCAVGYQFATKNELPEGVVRVILNHHRPYEEQHHQDLVALVATADRIANHCQRKHKFNGYDFAGCPAYSLMSQYWTPPRKEAFQKAIAHVVVKALRETRMMMKSAA